jgi:3-deoxy-7-phosphoheptulonate synthase
MIIAGNCSFVREEDVTEILETAYYLRGIANYYRCKLWLGGTTPDRYVQGIKSQGLPILEKINRDIPTITEVQCEKHIHKCKKLAGIWIGARNSQNYKLLEDASEHPGQLFIKRGFGMTTDETIGLFDIMYRIHNKVPFIIDRGINTFDRRPDSRWMPDIRNAIQLKNERPDIFNHLVIDCSHSVGKKEYIADTYLAFKAIGVRHFMFECSYTGFTRTDKEQNLTVDELRMILK